MFLPGMQPLTVTSWFALNVMQQETFLPASFFFFYSSLIFQYTAQLVKRVNSPAAISLRCLFGCPRTSEIPAR